MLTVLSANSQAGGYRIPNSLRFRSSASAYLSRTPASAGNRTTWTWSGWVKRGTLGASQVLFDCEGGFTDTTFGEFGFNGSDAFEFIAYNLSWRVTSQVFRDPSAWYHLVVAFDTTQATAANRVKIYVNGYQITAFSTSNDPAQNTSYAINQAAVHNIAKLYGGRGYFDGYLADINFIDGQALTPSSFGEIDSTTGVWKAKRYTGTYGTNGFKLNFSNGTSTTTLGYDSSGNGNNWTTNNISLTAGSTYDWMIDSPTPYQGSSYGVGNYAVLNPLIQSANTFSNGNLTLTASASAPAKFVSSIGATSGKWYMEFGLSALSIAPIGISKDTTPRDYLGMSDGSSSVSFWPASSGTPIYVNGSSVAWSGSGTTWTTSDVAGLALDVDASTIALYKNGTLVGSAFSYSSYWTGLTYFAGGNYVSGLVYTANFGQRPFAYTPPSGYKSLCTQNLPGVTIQNGASYMAATTYTANGGVQPISNAVNAVSFQPDFVWIKSRSAAAGHTLFDSIRGAANYLVSNTTAAEVSASTYMTSFNSGGFSMGSGNDPNGRTMVGWQWKAGGTAVTNTAGSITSQVSANPTAGFSVVTYTGTGANATVGHGLGVAPSMMIIKGRTNTSDWPVYHVSTGNGGITWLDLTNAFSTGNAWNSTTPSSTVFTIGANANTNTSSINYVAYCFTAIPGYSAFGSYTGNGSADGPFVYCGFRPRWVLVKCSSSTENWYLHDSSRDSYNQVNTVLYPNLSNAEGSSNANMDFLSNGFKIRESGSASNSSGATYIYAAFAENPFQNALAR